MRAFHSLQRRDYFPLIALALAEDIGKGDATSLSIIPEKLRWEASLVAREDIVVAALSIAKDVFEKVDPKLHLTPKISDGQKAAAGCELMRVEGSARSILSAERTALNFLQKLCGIATLTRQYVCAIADFPTKILDTRKTTPGWRRLEKYAVACGGGSNHRMGLFDGIIVKDNHLAALSNETNSIENPIENAVRQAKASFPFLKIEVEADSFEQAKRAVEAGADVILLDNMTPNALRECVAMIGKKAKTEASGGITLKSIQQIAEAGVDYISIGALTHSARSVDLSLDIVKKK